MNTRPASTFAALSLILFACGCRSALTPLPPKETRTYQSLLEWTCQNGTPGAVLLVKTPTTNFIGNIGYADVKRKIPMQADHEFRIGSITKTFTGIAAAQLDAEGILDSEKVITNYLPASITSHIRNSNRITVRQLVRHTSGIDNYNSHFFYMLRRYLLNRRDAWPPLRELKYTYDQPARFPPGEGWEYSNSNFLLLGLIIDRLTELHHSVEIRKRLLDPLQLTNTYYELNEPPIGELAHGYERLLGFRQDCYDWTPIVGGNSGLVSTVSDLAVFIRAVKGTNGFLNQATRDLLRSQPNPKSINRSWYPVLGYDFGVNHYRGANDDVSLSVAPIFFGHSGAVPGYSCFAWHEPEHDITVVFFGNSAQLDGLHPRRTLEFEHVLENAVLELAVEQRRRTSAGKSPEGNDWGNRKEARPPARE